MLQLEVPNQRILKGVAATLTWVYLDQDGEASTPPGTVTVGIVNDAGTVIKAPGTSTSAGDDTGERTVSLTAAETASLGLYTVTWTDSAAGSYTTRVEIVGGYLFGIAQLRAAHDTLQATGTYPAETIVAKRNIVEVEAEAIIGHALVPRHARVTISGTGERDLQLPHAMARTVTAVTVDGTALTADELADLVIAGEFRDILRKPAGDAWPVGDGSNVVVTYSHGLDTPYGDVVDAAMVRTRWLLNRPKSGAPENATAFTPDGGASITLAQPGKYRTGLPEVDAVYLRRSIVATDEGGAGGSTSSGARPASGRLDMNPQSGSLFHGGRR